MAEAAVVVGNTGQHKKPGSPCLSSPAPDHLSASGNGRSRWRLLFALLIVGTLVVMGDGAGVPLNGRRTGDEEQDEPLVDVVEEGDELLLPRCYSSLEADPSRGEWRKCDGGVEESPAYSGNFTGLWTTDRVESRCRGIWVEENREGPMPYWTWEASGCRLEELDAAKFCGIVEGRKGILFVGDSLTGQMIDTLAAVLRATVVEHVPLTVTTYSACGGALAFSWYRNDYLDTRTDAFDTVHCEDPDVSMSHCMVFADDATLSQFDTIIVNAGAHKRSGGIPAYGAMMKTASEDLTASMKRLHGEDAVLVVRNSVPGHGSSYERMFDGPVDVETALTLVGQGLPRYHWADFSDMNKLLEEAFVTTNGWTLLDAYTPTLLRADSHAGDDGLHYCLPGPIDHWVRLLYNILLERASPERAQDQAEDAEP